MDLWLLGVWTLEQKIVPVLLNSVSSGYSVSLNGNGNTCVIGVPYENNGGTNRGSAYIYTRVGVVWNLEQKIVPIVPNNDDYFGQSTSLSGDGNICIIGTPFKDSGGANSGSAYIFIRTGISWTQEQQLNPVVQPNANLGKSVSLSGDGYTCIVGTPSEDNGGIKRGSAYIYTRNLGVWTQEQKLNPVLEDGANFGESVSLSGVVD